MAFNPNRSPNPKTRRHQRGFSPSNFSENSGMESHHFMSPHEHDENRGLFAKGYDSSSPIDFSNSENRRVLTERNINYFSAPKERKPPNSEEIDFGSALFGDSSKPSRIQLEGETECRCELGSVFRSNSNSNVLKARTFQSPERGTRSNFTQNEKFDSDFEFDSQTGETRELGFRPLHRVSSVGNLAELESKFEFGSGLRRSASPKLRSTPNYEMGFYSPSFRSESRRKSNEIRCQCELGSSNREFKWDQSPIFGSFHSPKTNYLSQRPQFLRNRSKSEFRNSPFTSHYSQEKSNFDSLSKKPEKKVVVRSETERPSGISKSPFCFSKLIKAVIFFGFFIMACLFVKEETFIRSNLGSSWSLIKNLTDFSLNPEYLGDFLSFNEDIQNSEIKIAEMDQNLGEKKEKEDSFEPEIEKKIEALELNNPELIKQETPTSIECEEIEENNEKLENPIDENGNFEEIQTELVENEINSEKTEQPEVSNEFEKPISGANSKTDQVSSCIVLVPVQTGMKEKEEKSSKDALRIRFCVAFICVAVCASLVSCFIKREQFFEILKRNYYSSKNNIKGPKKRLRDEQLLANEESYGSFLTYEKIPIKKRFGEEVGLLTPVRRSNRIRNHITSPSSGF